MRDVVLRVLLENLSATDQGEDFNDLTPNVQQVYAVKGSELSRALSIHLSRGFEDVCHASGRYSAPRLLTSGVKPISRGRDWQDEPRPLVIRYLRMFTARATTITASDRLIADCTSINIFAHRLSGSASVGLNADEFVNDTNR